MRLSLPALGEEWLGSELTLLPSLPPVQLVCLAQERWRRTKKTTFSLRYLNHTQQL